MNQLVAQSSDLATEVGETTEVSWTAPADLTFEHYQQIGRTFQQIQRSIAWWVGDWLNEGERRFGDMYLQAIEETGKSYETLIKWKAVSDRIAKDIRQKSLSWTHHFYVAYVDADQRGPLLECALNVGLSSRELMQVAKLDWNQREDLMVAASEGIDHDSFMRLVNKFRLGLDANDDVARPEEDDEDEEDLPFTDLDGVDDEDEDALPPDAPHLHGLDYDSVMDFWENNGSPLKFCGQSEAIWEGMAVRAGQDEAGRLILIWEQIP